MTFTHTELCIALSKSNLYIRNIQKALALPVKKPDEKYSEGYKIFLENIINLKTLGVSNEDIARLLEIEKKILHLLQIDSIDNAPTWYLDHCENKYAKRKGKPLILLLTDYELELSPHAQSLQGSLDFTRAQEIELFKGHEMGEDINKAIDKYRQLEEKVLEIMAREVSVTERASVWARSVLRKKR
jgi:hypothetical protein